MLDEDWPLLDLLRQEPVIESPFAPERECPHGNLPTDRERRCACHDEERA